MARILEVESVYPSPVVGDAVLLKTKAYQVGHAGVQRIEYSDRNGFVVVTGVKATIEVPVAWLRLGETPAPVAAVDEETLRRQREAAGEKTIWEEDRTKPKRGKR